jgi:hypothetical protein
MFGKHRKKKRRVGTLTFHIELSNLSSMIRHSYSS